MIYKSRYMTIDDHVLALMEAGKLIRVDPGQGFQNLNPPFEFVNKSDKSIWFYAVWDE